MEDLQHVRIGQQPLEVRRVIGRAAEPHDVGVAVARRELHHAQRIAAEAQAHGLGVDRHHGAKIEAVGQVAVVQMDAHATRLPSTPRPAPAPRARRVVPRKGLRTSTAVKPLAPEASASTNSATWARHRREAGTHRAAALAPSIARPGSPNIRQLVQHDGGRRGDFSRNPSRRHGMATLRAARRHRSGGKPGPSAPKQGRRAVRPTQAPPAARPPPGLSARAVKPAASRPARLASRQPRERDLQGRADRHPDGLAIERIAAGGVEQHRIGAESRGVAEQAADIVVVGDAEQHQHRAPRRQAGQQRRRAGSAGAGAPMARTPRWMWKPTTASITAWPAA